MSKNRRHFKIIHKDVFREIKKSAGRFISLFLIVALGVAFYAGIRSCSPDMLYSADAYFDDYNLMDIRVVSTLGLTDADIRTIEKVDGVDRAYGAYTADLICETEEESHVVKLMSITEGVNEIVLLDGIMPVNDNECLIDENYMEECGYEIGDEITFSSGDDTELKDILSGSKFIITGTFASPRYLSFDFGSTSIGSGAVDGLVMVNESAFTYEYFTEIAVIVSGASELLCYSDEYEALIEEVAENIEDVAPGAETRRYEEILEEAQELIEKARTRLSESEESALEEIDAAQASLDSYKSQAESMLAEFASLIDLIGEFKDAAYETAEESQEALDRIQAASSDLYSEVIDGGYDGFLNSSAKQELADLNEKLQEAESQAEVISEIYQSANSLYSTLSSNINYYLQTQQDAIDEQLALLEEEIAEALAEIEESEAELDDVEEGQWYVLDRTYLQDYSGYESDAEKIGNIGKVFPVIFFIVAALVCLTTMTRMVDEERTQIGTLKALGYGKGTIISKYILYALIATLAGSVIGCIAGSITLPLIIINVYKLLYDNLQYILVPFNWDHCIAASLLSLGCILIATLAACLKSLMEVPANLMRPASPKKARKLLIERIKPLWHIIPFGWKNAFRNFVRYKKRLFMTLFGILGSTALLLVGFGLQDAINSIVDRQYGGIHLYDETLTLNSDATQTDKDLLYSTLDSDEDVAEYISLYLTSADAESESYSGTLSCYVYVTPDTELFKDFVIFAQRESGESVYMDDETVIISEKAAQKLGLETGDTFVISNDGEDQKTLTVGGMIENYVYHNIFMSEALYEELYGQTCEANQILINAADEDSLSADEFGEKYLSLEAVSGVTNIASQKEYFADMLSSLDTITLVLIICAGALTFIVLFNLTNINISERRRELATLKVLGFYDIELSQYIYRENFMITVLGIALGLFFGRYLNDFVVTTVEVDIVMFAREIYVSSYIISAVIAFVFAVIVNVIVHFKLKKIDMATSLKSVE